MTVRPTIRPHHRKTNVFFSIYLFNFIYLNQCLLSHFLASLGDQEKTTCTSMLWSIDSWPVSPDRTGAQVSSHRGRVFFEVIHWHITSFKWPQAQVYFFNDSYEICCLYVTMAPHCKDFDFKLTSDAKIQPVFKKYRRGRPFHTMVTRWSRSTSNFYPLIGKNLTGRFMRNIYAASWQLFTLAAEANGM